MSIFTKEIEIIILKQEEAIPDWFTFEFYQTFKGEFIPILYKFFQKIKAEKMVPNLFYEVSITLLKQTRKFSLQQNYPLAFLMNTHIKILSKIVVN